MGIAWLLLMRTFATRPKRTVLFLLGYALATTVMITLLAVGQAVLLQAQDKDLLGGGDIILVPQGIDIESMKVGGIVALYYSIPQARFIVRQILHSSRFENEIGSVSPYLFSKLLYARSRNKIETIFAEGSIPKQEEAVKQINLPWENSAEDDAWLEPRSSELYHDIDHFHLPTIASPAMDRWAEWHYFNFESDRFHGYLSIMVAGNILKKQAKWIVSLQMIDNQYKRYEESYQASTEQLPLHRVDYSVGENHIKFNNDHYEISLNFQDQKKISGDLLFYPAPRLYFPPAELARSESFESGYVIPAIRGKYQGRLTIGNTSYDFNGVEGYHDHNWGIWQKIEWNWGHLFSPEYAIFFGEIFLDAKSKGLFVGVFDRKGFVSMFRPERIQFSNFQPGPGGALVPMKFQIQQSKRFAALDIDANADFYIPTPVDQHYFIQYKMNYLVRLNIDGKLIQFPAKGNAETYVKKK